MNPLTASKAVARLLWFRQGQIRQTLARPYRGLRFEIAPQIHASRMHVFFRANEPEVTATLRRLMIAPMVVFDVGAHVGRLSLSKEHPTERIILRKTRKPSGHPRRRRRRRA